MASAWKAAGLTYNRYLAIAARAVRNSLKEDIRVKTGNRGNIDIKVSKWENGKQLESKNLATEANNAILDAAKE